jgi:two-component system, cell cycle sensor histidine kinase and response regulator CckA
MTSFESLPWPVAIIDASGRIVTANTRWRGVDPGHPFAGGAFAVGVDYAAICEALGTDVARQVALATRAVLSGTSREQETSYGIGGRWFRLSVTAHDHQGAVVCSSEITASCEALSRREAFSAAVIEASLDLTTVFDRTGTIVYESASVERLLGYAPESLVGQNGFTFVHPEDAPHVQAMFEELSAEPGSRRSFMLRLRRGDGVYRVFEANATNRLDDPAVGGIVVSSRDVTDRVEAEVGLESVRARLAGILEVTEDGVVSVDRAQRVTMFNGGAERIFGYVASEVIGQPLAKLLPPQLAASHEAYVEAFSEGGVSGRRMAERRAVLGRRRDGSDFHAEISISCFDAGGERVLTAFVRDTTARERAAEALRESQDRLRTVVEGAPILLFAMDRDGVFTLSEGKALESLGLASGQVVGLSAHVLYKDVPGFGETFRRALAGEVVHLTSQTGRVSFEAVYSPLRDRAGQILGVTGVGFDISERKRLEEQLLHAQRMESIGRLAGGVAHDFNNLLTVILGVADLLADSLPAGDSRAADVEQIAEAGRRAAELTSQLLAFARKQIISPKLVDLGDSLARLEKILARMVGEDIDIVMTSQPGLDPVLVDPTQFDQIVINLAINARDAMPNPGTLTIELANVTLADDYVQAHGEATPGPHVRLAVSDTGTGMDPDVMAHVFEPFFTTKPQGKGTGLGLSTCYGSVRQAGGHMTVESEPAKGSRFMVYLPSAPGTAGASAVSAARVTQRPRRETVLLVDDDSLVRSLVARALRAGGFTVLVAESGSEALAIANAMPHIDLLLTDVVMPKMSGKELAALLRARTPSLRVLYISGYTEAAVVQHGLEEGISFLAKPFTPTSLLGKVHEMLPAISAG